MSVNNILNTKFCFITALTSVPVGNVRSLCVMLLRKSILEDYSYVGLFEEYPFVSPLEVCQSFGATENAGVEKSARSKMQWWKMRELTSVQWQ